MLGCRSRCAQVPGRWGPAPRAHTRRSAGRTEPPAAGPSSVRRCRHTEDVESSTRAHLLLVGAVHGVAGGLWPERLDRRVHLGLGARRDDHLAAKPHEILGGAEADACGTHRACAASWLVRIEGSGRGGRSWGGRRHLPAGVPQRRASDQRPPARKPCAPSVPAKTTAFWPLKEKKALSLSCVPLVPLVAMADDDQEYDVALLCCCCGASELLASIWRSGAPSRALARGAHVDGKVQAAGRPREARMRRRRTLQRERSSAQQFANEHAFGSNSNSRPQAPPKRSSASGTDRGQ